MSDIFREVDEAMQQEKLVKLWKEYSTTIIFAVIVLLVSSAATSYYYKWQANKNATETAKLTTALQADNPQEAVLEAIKTTHGDHKAVGLMNAANMALQEGKTEEASTLYQQVIDDKKAPRNIRDLARIYFIQTTKEPQIDVLKPLLANTKSPWVWHAKLEAATLTAHNDKDYAKALDYLKGFKKQEYLPFSLKERAQALSHVYAIKQANQKPEEDPKTDTTKKTK